MMHGKLPVVLTIFAVFLSGCVGQPTAETTTTTGLAEARQASLAVSSQPIDDSAIVVDSLYLDKPGYLVVHKDADGKPGPVIGNSDLLSGEKTGIKVAIDASQAGTKVFAMLHYDDDLSLIHI